MSNYIKRLSAIITANMNTEIEQMENPEQLIKQAIREMEENISLLKQEVVYAVAGKNRLYNEKERNAALAEKWLQNAEIAISENNEELAKSSLLRKKEFQGIEAELTDNFLKSEKNCDRLKSRLNTMKTKLEEAKRHYISLVARQRAAQARKKINNTTMQFEKQMAEKHDFCSLELKIDEMEACVEAYDEVEIEENTLEKEIDQLAVNREIENELAALKEKVNR